MKLSAGREALLKPLQAVIGVVERRQTMPILANILMVVRHGKLALTATDLEVELVASTEVEAKQDGEITVPGRKLLDICRALPEGANIRLEFHQRTITESVLPYLEDGAPCDLTRDPECASTGPRAGTPTHEGQ